MLTSWVLHSSPASSVHSSVTNSQRRHGRWAWLQWPTKMHYLWQVPRSWDQAIFVPTMTMTTEPITLIYPLRMCNYAGNRYNIPALALIYYCSWLNPACTQELPHLLKVLKQHRQAWLVEKIMRPTYYIGQTDLVIERPAVRGTISKCR